MLALLALVAGRYVSLMGTERAELTLKPTGGYAYLSQGCFHHEVSSGTYSMEGGSIALVPPAEILGSLKVDTLRAVRWGGSTFLLPEADLAAFAARVRDGWRGEARDFGYLRADSLGAVKGEPELPTPWHSQLNKGLDVHVTSVDGASLMLDGGTGEGIRTGTTLSGTVDGCDILVVVRTAFAHQSLGAWGTLDGGWPSPSFVGIKLRLGTEKSGIARFLSSVILKGDLIPKPEEPS